jgi:hypothetical protein
MEGLSAEIFKILSWTFISLVHYIKRKRLFQLWLPSLFLRISSISSCVRRLWRTDDRCMLMCSYFTRSLNLQLQDQYVYYYSVLFSENTSPHHDLSTFLCQSVLNNILSWAPSLEVGCHTLRDHRGHEACAIKTQNAIKANIRRRTSGAPLRKPENSSRLI